MKLQASLRNYTAILSSSLVAGEDPLIQIKSAIRSHVQAFAVSTGDSSETGTCSQEVITSTPLSALESHLGVQASQVTTPLCSSTPDNTLRVSVISLSSTLFGSSLSGDSNTQLDSDPLTLTLSQLPCLETEEDCRIKLVLKRKIDLSSSKQWNVSDLVVETKCTAKEQGPKVVTCRNGLNFTVYCNGSEASIRSQCPMISQLPSCSVLFGETVSASPCQTIAYTNDNITCSCAVSSLVAGRYRRLQNSNSTFEIDKEVEVNYLSMLRSVTGNFESTVMSAGSLDAGTLERGWQALIVVGTIVTVFILAMIYAYRADQKSIEEEKVAAQKEKQMSKLARMTSSRRLIVTADDDAEDENSSNNKGFFKLAEEALPQILSSRSFTTVIKNEIKRHHRWFGVVFHYSPQFPRMLRVVSLTTNIVIMLFVQSLTYSLTSGDDGTCETFTTEMDCLAPPSAYATGSSKCYWTPESHSGNSGSSGVTSGPQLGSCAYVQPDNSLYVMVFVAVFSAIVSTPIAILADQVILKVLAAPTIAARISKRKLGAIAPDTSGPSTSATNNKNRKKKERTSFTAFGRKTRSGSILNIVLNTAMDRYQVNSDSSSSDKTEVISKAAIIKFKALAAALYHYRQEYLLQDEKQRQEFDALWGLDQNGKFRGNLDDVPSTESSVSPAEVVPHIHQNRDIQTDHNHSNSDEKNDSHEIRIEESTATSPGNNDVHPLQRRSRASLRDSLIQVFRKPSPSVIDLILRELEELEQQTKTEIDRWKKERILTISEREKSKRLMYLFQKDLLPGINGVLLESKNQRDAMMIRGTSRSAKLLGWSFLASINIGMLFYILLFALSQDTHHQSAWGQSFALWLVVEILLVSSIAVFVMHIVIPSLLMKDVGSIRKKLIVNVMNYYQAMAANQRLQGMSSETRYQVMRRRGEAVEGEDMEQKKPFNAAEYLFLSHRIARRYQDLQVAKMILSFTTPWPKQSYQHIHDVSKKYNRRFTQVNRSLSMLLLFFLTSFLAVPISIQDMVMNIAMVTVTGYTMVLHIQLYQVFPVLVVVPVAFIGLIIHFIMQSEKAKRFLEQRNFWREVDRMKQQQSESQQQANKDLETTHQEEKTESSFEGKDEENDYEQPLHFPEGRGGLLTRRKHFTGVGSHVGRRQSLHQGISLAKQLRQYLRDKDQEGKIDEVDSSSLSSAFSSGKDSYTIVAADSSSSSEAFQDGDNDFDLSQSDSNPSATAAVTSNPVIVLPRHRRDEEESLLPVDDSWKTNSLLPLGHRLPPSQTIANNHHGDSPQKPAPSIISSSEYDLPSLYTGVSVDPSHRPNLLSSLPTPHRAPPSLQAVEDVLTPLTTWRNNQLLPQSHRPPPSLVSSISLQESLFQAEEKESDDFDEQFSSDEEEEEEQEQEKDSESLGDDFDDYDDDVDGNLCEPPRRLSTQVMSHFSQLPQQHRLPAINYFVGPRNGDGLNNDEDYFPDLLHLPERETSSHVCKSILPLKSLPN